MSRRLMVRIFVSLVALSTAYGHSFAQDEKGTVTGAGWVPCAEFAQNYQRSPQSTEDYFFAWAQGYISGLNRVSQPRKNVRGWTLDKQKEQIRAFCDQRPLANYIDAVDEVFINLPNR